MAVQIIDYTGFGMGPEYAARLLAFTKATRLNMTPGLLDEMMNAKPWAIVEEELSYMAFTLPSSWEFVSVTFLVSEVSRACAQQITRTRTASYAMQAQRIVDVRDAGYHVPDLDDEASFNFHESMQEAISNYSALRDSGMKPEDAREVLPIGIHCNLVVKHNLRSLVDLVAKRRSLRVQSEYRGVVEEMRSTTVAVWPWAEQFFRDKHEMALESLEAIAKSNPSLRIPIAKAVDLIRNNREG